VPESATNTLPALSEATPWGLPKLAEAPTPSTEKAEPLPASVLSVPLGHATRTRWLPVSVTYSGPPPPAKRPSKAMWRGDTRVPTPRGPSEKAGATAAQVPAYVVDAPPDSALADHCWMQKRPRLTTRMACEASEAASGSAMPTGDASAAPVYTVLTAAVVPLTRRSALPVRSDTHRSPNLPAVIAHGLLKRAAVPTPSVTLAAVPLRPARPVMVPFGKITRTRLSVAAACVTNTSPARRPLPAATPRLMFWRPCARLPSALPAAVPAPATVLDVHASPPVFAALASSASPGALHKRGHSQVRGGAAPPVQKLPAGHSAPPAPPAHPGGQP
jgi:hypothetical protein